MAPAASILYNHKLDKRGVPSFRAVAHIIANDPGIYFKDHYGCMAYGDNFTGPSWPLPGNPLLGGQGESYTCCNKKIEDFDLTASRTALLRFLILSSWPNLEAFIDTVSCPGHRADEMTTAFLRSHWFDELGHSRSPQRWEPNDMGCWCCSKLKPTQRWDAGMSAAELKIVHALGRHERPDARAFPTSITPVSISARESMTQQQQTVIQAASLLVGACLALPRNFMRDMKCTYQCVLWLRS